MWPMGLLFKYLFNVFYYFAIISPSKRAWPFIWTKLIFLHLRMFCAKFGWNMLSEIKKELLALYLNNLEFPLPWFTKVSLCQDSLKLAHCFSRCRFEKVIDRKSSRAFSSGELENYESSFGSLKVVEVLKKSPFSLLWLFLQISDTMPRSEHWKHIISFKRHTI